MKCIEIITCTCLLVLYVMAVPYEDLEPGNNDEWLLYHNEYGTHFINFSVVPHDKSDLKLGDAYYYLYTRRNTIPEELHIGYNPNEIFRSQFLNSSNPIKVITHGWLSSDKEKWLQSIKDELLIKDDYNVITIDWNELAGNQVYPWTVFCTRYVGKKTARLLDAIARAYKINGRHVHLLGHSLGAHVMGYAASFLSFKVHRITGLDPARPLFELPMMPEQCRLEKSDADFVDIIHTCGGAFGYLNSHGHADFYPNGGTPIQPGSEGTDPLIDSHGRANLYFAESINAATRFKAYRCESWDKFKSGVCIQKYTYMGFDAKIGDCGNYYMHTNDEPPFAIEDKI